MKKPTKITKEIEDKVILLYTENKTSNYNIANEVGINISTIWIILKRNNCQVKNKKLKPTKITKKIEDRVIFLYRDNKISSPKIAKELNISETAVLSVLKRNKCAIMTQKYNDKNIIKEVIALYVDGNMSMSNISKKVNTCVGTIRVILRNNNIKVKNRPKIKISEEDEQEIVKLYVNGSFIKTISKKFSISYSCVRRILKENNVYIKSSKHKFITSKEDVQEIINIYKNDQAGMRKIAKMFNINKSTVWHILKRNNVVIRTKSEAKVKYKHLEGNILRMYNDENKSSLKIAKIIGCSKGTILRILKNNNCKRRKISDYDNARKNKTSFPVYEIIKLYVDEGRTVRETAKLVECSYSSVLRVLKTNGIIKRKYKRPHKKTNEIISLYNSGFSIIDISKKLIVPDTTVYYVLKMNHITTRIDHLTNNNRNNAYYIKITGFDFETYIKKLPVFKRYQNLILKLTRKQKIKFLPNFEKRGHASIDGAYHLDHKFSIREAFKLGINPELIANINNLEMIPAIKNIQKNDTCSTTLEELQNLTDYKIPLYIHESKHADVFKV